MTLSLTCDPAQIEARKAALIKKHEELDTQINSLASTKGGRISNDDEIKRLKNAKIPLKRAITACDEHLAKLKAEAAKKARQQAAAAKAAQPEEPPRPEATGSLSYLSQPTGPKQPAKSTPNGLTHNKTEHAAA